jgi:GMP synthase-like glutamine amidotransferase
MRVLIVQNDETESLGLYEQHLSEKGIDHQVLHAYRLGPNSPFPRVEDFDAFIVGPTPISANDVESHDFLRGEWSFLGGVVESRKPTLGVCCGGQMLARYLGGKVVRSPEREVGGYEVHLTDLGEADPFFAGFPREFPVFHWHAEMFQVPPGGSLLAVGVPCPIQAFGWENIRGVIFHLEVTSADALRWADAYPRELEAVGKTRDRVVEECREREPEMRRLASLLMDNFLAIGSSP